MITKDQVAAISKAKKINETVIFREYLQLLFLSNLYTHKESTKIFFKGGTAIHLIFKAPRFSEDLDFTVELNEKDFQNFIIELLTKLSKEENITFKEKKTIAGKSYLLTSSTNVLPYKIFVSLDFSFRERILSPQKSIIETDFPILFTSHVYHPSRDEIFAEKIRALLTRKKGRDLYDLWYLMSIGTKINNLLVKKKLEYYKLDKMPKENILKRIKEFDKNDFITDLRPFVPINERPKLDQLYSYIVSLLSQKL